MEEKRFELAEITSEQPEGGLDYLRFTVPDLHGIGRTVTVPKRHIQRSIENNGVSMFAGETLFMGCQCFLVSNVIYGVSMFLMSTLFMGCQCFGE